MIMNGENMKEIIILVHGYDNDKSNNPNSLCLNDMIPIMSEFMDIIIITTTMKDSYFYQRKGNVDIHYIPLEIKFNGKYNFKKWGTQVIDLVSRKKLINEKSKMLNISFPFDILRVGLKIKKKYPELYWVIYELDPFTYNSILRFQKIAFVYRFLLESNVFRHSNKILLTHELMAQYSNNLLNRYKLKFKDIGIPILKITNNNNNVGENIDLIYIGSFYKNIRDPEYMFEVISKLIEINDKICLHIYGPEINSLPNELMTKYNNNIYAHGRVSKEEINKAVLSSNILINIGNSVENQLPSKILEYIGVGKPIINFYSIENDTSNVYLKDYPIACLIFENWDTIQSNVAQSHDFITKNFRSKVDEKILNEIFYNDKLEIVTKKVIEELI